MCAGHAGCSGCFGQGFLDRDRPAGIACREPMLVVRVRPLAIDRADDDVAAVFVAGERAFGETARAIRHAQDHAVDLISDGRRRHRFRLDCDPERAEGQGERLLGKQPLRAHGASLVRTIRVRGFTNIRLYQKDTMKSRFLKRKTTRSGVAWWLLHQDCRVGVHVCDAQGEVVHLVSIVGVLEAMPVFG